MTEKASTNAPEDRKLFCVGLTFTSFRFILSVLTLPQWGTKFNLTSTQLGEITNTYIRPLTLKTLLT
jgi:hypothetical protein